MSSFVRTLSKRIMAAKGVDMIPVLNPFHKKVIVGHIYPHVPGQLAQGVNGERIMSPEDPSLTSTTKAIVELLHNDRQERLAALASA